MSANATALEFDATIKPVSGTARHISLMAAVMACVTTPYMGHRESRVERESRKANETAYIAPARIAKAAEKRARKAQRRAAVAPPSEGRDQ